MHSRGRRPVTPLVALPAAPVQGPAGRLRADVGVVLWLKGKDLGGTGHPVAARVLASGYALAACAVLAAAAYLHQVAPLSAPTVSVILVPLWLLWALLPAVGGGGVVESSAGLAPYPVRGRVHLLSAWLSAVLDLQYLVPVPAVTAALVAAYGPAAVLPALAFVVGASAVGQLLAWAVGGGLRPTRGVGLGGTALAVALVAGAFFVHGRGTLASLGTLPTTWLLNGCRDGAGGLWLPWLGWSAVAALPAVVLVGLGTTLVGRALAARAAGRPPRAARGLQTSAGLPTSPVAALVTAATRGVLRSVAFRAAALMALAVPFVTAAAFPGVSATALFSMTLISGGATLAANAWAFDAGGVVLWLAAPVSRVRVVLARAVAIGVSLLGLLVAVTVSAVLAGVTLGGAGTAGFTALLLPVVICAGLRTATKYPSMADLDSLRGRPTTPWASVTYTLRAGLGAALLVSLWAVPGRGPAVAAGGAVMYCLVALWASARGLRDGTTMLAAFAGTG
jgi:hypothetical protein